MGKLRFKYYFGNICNVFYHSQDFFIKNDNASV